MSLGGRIQTHIADDRQTVTVTIEPQDDSPIEIVLTVDQLTGVIQFLGQTRCKMVDGLRAPPLEGETVFTVNDPPWFIQPAKIDGPLLAMHHPAFGPMGIALSRENVAEIVRLFKNYLALPPATSHKTQRAN